ncbi:MAG TPA: hypothetical protein VMS86_03525, partial [Thermoanaerobaculia bacterium]|nr:hypothetical protein [Thermoanaerobaculia bacterium]
SFAAILRATLGERFRPAAGATGSASPAHDPREQKSEQRIGSADGTEGASGGDVGAAGAASVLYRAGDLGAVGASIAAAGAQARVGRQGVLPWPAVARAVEGRALRPAVAIEDLALAGGLRAAELLAPASPDGGGGAEAGWREVEAILAAGSDAAHRAVGASRPAAADEGSDPVAEPAPPSEVARARAWLLADGRRIERLERRRRFACSIGGTAVGGELPRVWIASAPGVAPRALVGGELAAAPRHAADGSSPAGVVRAPLGKADVLRLAAARALGIAASSRAGETHEIAVLLCGPGSRLLSLPP